MVPIFFTHRLGSIKGYLLEREEKSGGCYLKK
jgi:hypothetical protein